MAIKQPMHDQDVSAILDYAKEEISRGDWSRNSFRGFAGSFAGRINSLFGAGASSVKAEHVLKAGDICITFIRSSDLPIQEILAPFRKLATSEYANPETQAAVLQFLLTSFNKYHYISIRNCLKKIRHTRDNMARRKPPIPIHPSVAKFLVVPSIIEHHQPR